MGGHPLRNWFKPAVRLGCLWLPLGPSPSRLRASEARPGRDFSSLSRRSCQTKIAGPNRGIRPIGPRASGWTGFTVAEASFSRSSSREARIRVPTSFVVYSSRGTLSQKRATGHLAGGPSFGFTVGTGKVWNQAKASSYLATLGGRGDPVSSLASMQMSGNWAESAQIARMWG